MPRHPRPPTFQDDEPLSGKPLRNKAEADPRAVAPDLDLFDLAMLTGSGHRRAAGNADLRPPVDRAGSQQPHQHPSRRGDCLYYPDGRVTDLAGRPVDLPAVQRCSLPASVDDSARRARLNGRA